MLILSWIVNAKRRLKLPEIQHALATEVGKPYLDKDIIPSLQHIVTSCSPLVTFEKESNVIRLKHYTMQEYLEKALSNWFPTGKTEITRTLFAYLSFDEFGSGYCHKEEDFHRRIEKNWLYDYAARYWVDHARDALAPIQEVMGFLENSEKLTAALQTSSDFYNTEEGGDMIRSYASSIRSKKALHVAAGFGLEEITLALLNSKHDANAQDFEGMTPLSTAAKKGHKAVVQLLLDRNANVDIRDNQGRTPLMHAVIGHHDTVIRCLLDSGEAAVNAQDNDRLTPLAHAARNNNLEAVKMLLQSGADETLANYEKQTPQQHAVQGQPAI